MPCFLARSLYSSRSSRCSTCTPDKAAFSASDCESAVFRAQQLWFATLRVPIRHTRLSFLQTTLAFCLPSILLDRPGCEYLVPEGRVVRVGVAHAGEEAADQALHEDDFALELEDRRHHFGLLLARTAGHRPGRRQGRAESNMHRRCTRTRSHG
eukprot:2552675-Rhodomonas_salina.3